MRVVKEDAKRIVFLDDNTLAEESFRGSLERTSDLKEVLFIYSTDELVEVMKTFPTAVAVNLRIDPEVLFSLIEYLLHFEPDVSLLLYSYKLDGEGAILSIEFNVVKKVGEPISAESISEQTHDIMAILKDFLPVPVVKAIRRIEEDGLSLSESLPIPAAVARMGGKSGRRLKLNIKRSSRPPMELASQPESVQEEPEVTESSIGETEVEPEEPTMERVDAVDSMSSLVEEEASMDIPMASYERLSNLETKESFVEASDIEEDLYETSVEPELGVDIASDTPWASEAPEETFTEEIVEEKPLEPLPEDPLPETLPKYIVIGVGEDGLETLKALLSKLRADTVPPILVTLHSSDDMPEDFIDKLDNLCPIEVEEGMEFTTPESGHVYVAPREQHMQIGMNRRIQILSSSQGEPYCPSIDVLFQSFADDFPTETLAIILSGKGEDGAYGALSISEGGGFVIAQDRSSDNFEMPGAAIKLKAVNRAMDLTAIRSYLVRLGRIAAVRSE